MPPCTTKPPRKLLHSLIIFRFKEQLVILLGALSAETREIWFVVHGYGQLAEYFIRHFRGLDDGTRYIVAPEGLSRFYVKEWTRVGASVDNEGRPSKRNGGLSGVFEKPRSTYPEELEQSGGKRDDVRIWTLGFRKALRRLRAGLCAEVLPLIGLFAGQVAFPQK